MVANVDGLPPRLISGVPFTVEVTVQNQGQGDAGAFRTVLYASEDETITTSDTRIAESLSGTILEPGGSTTVRLSLFGGIQPSGLAPVTTSGLFADLGLTPGQTYYLGIIVDPDNQVPEEDEDNNIDTPSVSRPRVSFPQPIGGALSGAVTEDATETQVTGRATVDRVRFVAQTDAAGTYGTFNIETSGDWTYRLNNEDDDTNALAANQTATDAFRLTTTDSGGATVTITITGANDAATFSGTQSGAVTEDATDNRATGTITVSDVDGDNALKQQADQTGSYGSLSVNHSTGVWTYTLTNSGDNDQARATQALAGGETATETFTILAADDTPTTLTITITGVDDLSTLSGGFEGSVTEDSTTNATATGEITVADVDSTPIPTITAQNTTGTYGSFTLSKKTPSDEADRVYSWTYTLDNADEDTNALAAGAIVEDEFTITTSDGVNAKVTITITGADDSSTIGGALSGSVTEDDSDDLTAEGTATVTDEDSGATFTAQTDTPGSYGTFSITTAGVWTYSLDNSPGDTRGDATNALKAGQTESETFPITTSDNSSATVTIAVNGANDAAVFGTTGLTGAISEDADPNTTTGTAQATDVDGEDNKFTAVTAPDPVPGSYGSLTITEDGAWTYSLDNSNATVNALGQGATLTDSLTIQAKDGTAGTITITITGGNDKSSIDVTGSGGSVTEDDTANATVTGTFTLTDPDTSPLPTITEETRTGTYGQLAIAVKTSGINDGKYTWTYTLDNDDGDTNALAAGATATETFTIAASDNGEAMVTISITGANDAATIGGMLTGSVTEDDDDADEAEGTATITDVDGATFTAQTDTNGTYGTFSIEMDGEWTYTLDNSSPATNALGTGDEETDTFAIATNDGSTANVVITVRGSADIGDIGGVLSGSLTEDSSTIRVDGTATLPRSTSGGGGVRDLFRSQSNRGTYGTFGMRPRGGWHYILDNKRRETQGLKANEVVTDEFTIRSDSGLEGKVIITITGVNDPAVFDAATLTGAISEDADPNTVTGTAQATDVDREENNRFTAVTAPASVSGSYGSLTISEDGAWTYSLDNSNATVNTLVQGVTLTDSFTIQAKDGTTGTITITIRGVNDAATFSGTQTGAVTEDATLNTVTGTITVSDVDGDNALKQQADQTGSYGSLSVNHSTGVWTYTLTNSGDNAQARATQALAGGETATETFTILAADDTPTTLTITITGVNDAATIGGVLTGSITEDADPNTVTGTAQATDVDRDNNVFKTEVSPNDGTTQTTGTGTYGTLTITAAGVWTYTLDNDDEDTDGLDGTENPKKTDTFTIMAADGTSATITITITGVNDAPRIAITGSGGSLTEDATEDEIEGMLTLTDPDTTPLPTITEETRTGTYGRFAIARKTSGTNDGQYNWTYTLDSSDPNTAALRAGQSVTDTFTILAEDGTSATVTITVNGADDPSSIGGDLAGAVTENDTTNNRASGTVTISGTATITAKTETSTYGVFTLSADRTWTYTLDNSFPATNSLAVGATVTDAFTIAASDNSSATVIITITGADDPDLLVASVSGLPVQWKDGDSFTASASLRNQGKADAGSFEVGLYASADRTLTTGDRRIVSASVRALAKGASTSVSLAVSEGFDALGFTPGTYYLGVIADIGNRVAEADEDNNGDHANSIPAAASLIASDSTAPSETIVADSSYSGRWGWRGPGVDGPRGVAVDPWGTAAPISDFDTEESRFIGRLGDPLGAIGARQAYAMGLDGSGVVVAVVDLHIDKRHSDLDGNFLKHYDASGAGVVANNGYIHGTSVAGIIAAERNGEGMHGVAPGADLIGISFGISLFGGLVQSESDLGTSITSAVSDGAHIFNNSWGTASHTRGSRSDLDNSSLRKSFADAIDKGAVFVWAAGNRYSRNTRLGDNNTSEFAKAAIKYPELAGGFINVVNLAWDASNSVWTIANSTGSGADEGSQICGVTKDYCLAAPGTSITSTDIVVGDKNNRYRTASGTSYAAPMVSGGLAILFQAFPYVETSDIMRLLFETATDLGDEGVDSTYGHGMMNLAAALNPVGSASIPTTTSTATGAGIGVQASALLAEAPLRTAVAAATADMVMLDDYDRAFVIGDVMDDLAISDIQPLSIASADAVFASVDAELASLRDFGSPITQAAAKAGALTIIGDRLTLPSRSGTSEVVLNSIATEDSGLAEFRYVATRAEEGWQTSQSLGVIVEEDQLFGNKGSGAYALASQATTLSLGTSGQRDISEGVTLFGGLGLSHTEVSAADQSLVSLSSQFTSASGVMGLRMHDLGAEDRGEFATQLGQDRAILSGEGSISVPVGREEGGVILFDEVQFDSAALGLEPEVMVSYANEYAPDASYSLSAAGRGEETILSAQWQRRF